MGNEELFTKKYEEYLLPQLRQALVTHIKAGISFGMSQCTVYLVFASSFYFGGLLIDNSYDENTKTYNISPEDVFATMFAIMFGASQAGQAMQFGPDINKAMAAATNIFRVIEYPSKINAIEQDKKAVEYLDASNIKGVIEFKDVWFRYPSRKEEYVLRGLTMTI